MGTGELLDQLRAEAKRNMELREKLLATEGSDHPVRDFCRTAREHGFELYEMDLIDAGEDYYANMRRSTNGGGENSPLLNGEDDYYEIFLSELKTLDSGR